MHDYEPRIGCFIARGNHEIVKTIFKFQRTYH